MLAIIASEHIHGFKLGAKYRACTQLFYSTGTASSIRVPYYSAAAMMALVVAAVARRRGYISSPFQDSPSRQH